METINPYCFQICGLRSFAVASHSRPARGLERGHQRSIAAPDRLGRLRLSPQSVCLSFISPAFRTQQGQIPHPGTPGSSYPWSWAHHEIAWRGWEAASPGLGFQDFLVATLTGKVSSGSGAANGCISLFRPRTLQCLNWKVHTISAGVGETKKTQLK